MRIKYPILPGLLEHQKTSVDKATLGSTIQEGQMLSLNASKRMIYVLCLCTELKEPYLLYSQAKKKPTFSALSINIETLFFQHSSVHSGLIFSSRVLIVECLNWLIRIQYKVYAALLFNKCFGLLKKGLH